MTTKEQQFWNISYEDARKNLHRVLDEMNYMIAATPTGPKRDKLTDINIMLMQAATELNKVGKLA